MGFVTYGLFRTIVGSLWPPIVMMILAAISSALLLSGIWTEVQTLALKIAALLFLTSLPMFIFEMPFLYILRISKRRSEVVAYENAGAIAGVLLALGLKGLIAYSTLFIISIVFAAAASIYAIHMARQIGD